MIPTTLYGRLLGGEYAHLPRTVAVLHAREGLHTYRGEVRAVRGSGLLSRLCAAATRLPPPFEGPITVDIDADGHGETWTRRFGGHAMRSRLRAHHGRLRERLGLVTFDFRLVREGSQLRWSVEAVSALGIRLPARTFHDVVALESERDGRYSFDVRASLPGIGLLVHYHGTLEVD